MNKRLKKKLIEHNEEMRAAFPNLYDQKWVEKAADSGWKDLLENLERTSPRLAEMAKRENEYNIFAVIYYSSFETALNTFFMQCMEDSITNCEILIDELNKATATITTKIPDYENND